ncbi:MAG TPA: hypothetical protein VL404_00590 [Candidatus Eisenbacteria bacterium]|nr:hypothetical protein [Candidatus Eisenbacteria bacterium]
MAQFFESASCVLPSEVKDDVLGRLKETKGIESLEVQLSGDSLEGAREFGVILTALKKRGVKISHDVSIKLEFPRAISRERALSLVENLPKPRNGSVKVRIRIAGEAKS